MMIHRVTPVTALEAEAIQFDGSNYEEIAEFARAKISFTRLVERNGTHDEDVIIRLPGHDWEPLELFNYVVKTATGTCELVRSWDFDRKYWTNEMDVQEDGSA